MKEHRLPIRAAMIKALYGAAWLPIFPFVLAATSAFSTESARQRLGSAQPLPQGSRTIWLHAASVGEVEAARPIAQGLHSVAPDLPIVVTTMTPAGRAAAIRRIPQAASHSLAPLDFLPCVRRFVRTVSPSLLLLVETELWPNIILQSRRSGARIALVNGRMSERSFRAYRLARGFFAPIIGEIDLVLCQTAADANRFIELGALPERVTTTGNTKLDLNTEATELRSPLLEFMKSGPALVAGATAPGEDAMVLDAWSRLSQRLQDLHLVIAPRHLERVPEIERLIAERNIQFAKASSIRDSEDGAKVLLLDTMGELRAIYGHTQLAFIGGSLVPGRGGQSPAEAAAAGVPILIGPHHENQREIVSALVAAGGAFVVTDANALAAQAERLMSAGDVRREAGAKARAALITFSGAVEKTLLKLQPLIDIV